MYLLISAVCLAILPLRLQEAVAMKAGPERSELLPAPDTIPDNTTAAFRHLIDSIQASQTSAEEQSFASSVEIIAPLDTLADSWNSEFADALIAEARKHIGKHYKYGAEGPTVFDCSGFTKYCYRVACGIEISHSSREQAVSGRKVSGIADMKKGDIVLFGSRRNPKIFGHVGLVISADPEKGEFRFIHAANSGVQETLSTNAYYSIRYLGARRILN